MHKYDCKSKEYITCRKVPLFPTPEHHVTKCLACCARSGFVNLRNHENIPSTSRDSESFY